MPVTRYSDALKQLKPLNEGEEAFALHCTSYKLFFERQYKFDPKRKWLADFAFPAMRLLVEIEGGIWSGGRHTRPQGYLDDMEKYNAAAEAGWTVLRYSPEQVDSALAIDQVRRVLARKGAAL